jgi:hypothetical protein
MGQKGCDGWWDASDLIEIRIDLGEVCSAD